MKKLMIATMTAGLAVGAFAEEGSLVPCAIDFEDGTVGSAYEFDSEEAPQWVNVADKNTVKAYDPAKESNEKYLELSTDGEYVYRAFDTAANWGIGGTNYVNAGDALWIDTQVKFTASETAPTLDDGAKFGIWMKEIEGEPEATYELHALCGTINEGGVTTVADLVLDAQVNPTNWYRLTIRPDWDTSAETSFFTIKLDGVDVAATNGTVIVADPSGFTADNQALITAGKLFPSRVVSEKLVAVGFNGTGSIDDFTVTDEDPFYVPVTSVTLSETTKTIKVGDDFTLTATVAPDTATIKTVTWTSSDPTVATVVDGVVTGLTAGEVTITAAGADKKSDTCTVTVEAGGSITVVVPTDPSGNWTASAEPAEAAVGTEVTMTWTAAEGKFFANGESTITRTGALKSDGTLDATYPTAEELTTSTAEAKIDDVSYPTLLAAFEAAEDGDEITLAKDVTFAPETMYTIPKTLTLELNDFSLTGNGGKTFEVIDDKRLEINAIGSTITGVRINVGKAGNNNGHLVINGGDWTIDNNTVVHVNGECTDSDVRIEGATITSNGDNGIQLNGSGDFELNNATITGATAVYAKGGTINIDNGTFTGNGTKKSYVESSSGSNATGDAIVFDKTSAASGYANNLKVTITGGEFTSVNAEPVASYAMTGETPISKFISGGIFNKKPADALIADGYKAYQTGDGWTVEEIELVTLTITQVENCSIVVSNATDEVATDTKFDVKDETKLTVYRTPAAGYELDGYDAVETITMDEDQNVTAAVKAASNPVEPGNDGTAITPNPDGSVTIEENETNPGQASIKINDADTVIKVTSTITNIILSTGSETPAAGKIVVLSGNDTDITAYCKMTQTGNVIDVSLDKDKVQPEAKEPTTGTIADGKVSTAAIAGLEYSLVRTAELGVKGESVVTDRATGDTISLEDPMTGGKPNQAFYTIEVTK